MRGRAVPMFFVVTYVGLMVSLLAHIATFFGIRPDIGFVSIWVFLIAFLTIWTQPVLKYKLVEKDGLTDIWTFVMNNSPLWVKSVYKIMISYVLFNLLCWILLKGDGRELYEIRLVSSYCIGFYFISTVVLYRKMRKDCN